MEPSYKPTCVSCEYIFVTSSSTGTGYCYRYPPDSSPGQGSIGVPTVAVKTFWCGEFKLRTR